MLYVTHNYAVTHNCAVTSYAVNHQGKPAPEHFSELISLY